MFKKAWSSGFVSFNVENCINSTFDGEGKALSMSFNLQKNISVHIHVYMIKLVYDFLIGCEKFITQHPGWIT